MTGTWKIDQTKILSRGEIAAAIADAKRPAKRRSPNTRQNLVIFRLATCCGLRASELVGLKLGDIRVGIAQPYLRVPKTIAKGGKGRRVPLWWDRGTRDDIAAWRDERASRGAAQGDHFVCAQSKAVYGKMLTRHNARSRFIAMCKVLGRERQQELTIHTGRHSFVSHALAGPNARSLAEVRDAAGHSSLAITSISTHVAISPNAPAPAQPTASDSVTSSMPSFHPSCSRASASLAIVM